jgi:hypothetical protein
MKALFAQFTAALAVASTLAFAPAAQADNDGGRRYEISITNLTRGQQFTPILAAIHKGSVQLFKLGMSASPELATLAEQGDTGPLKALLLSQAGTGAVVTGTGLTNPGATSKLVLEVRGGFSMLSVAAMLIPTNDAFFALNGIELPHGDEVLTVRAPAYDSGSEKNDELCSSIPGPFFAECGGSGGGATVGGGEGYVHIHAGIHGIGSLPAAVRDWRNPVAQITIQRIK